MVIALSFIEPEDLPEWIVGEYADWIQDIHIKGHDSKLYQVAAGALKAAGKPLDFLGNMDLLLNNEKLARFAKLEK